MTDKLAPDASKFECVLGYPGPLPCRGCPPSCPEHPEAARPASELAADLDAIQRVFEMYGVNLTPVNMLVARVADLEAQVERQKGTIYALETNLPENYLESLRAAEAQVAALTQTVEQREIGYRDQLARAEAAEAALANTRQALADVEREIDAAWTKTLDDADAYDDEGAHVGLARHARAKGEGLAHAHSIVTIARRALAADDNTAEPAGAALEVVRQDRETMIQRSAEWRLRAGAAEATLATAEDRYQRATEDIGRLMAALATTRQALAEMVDAAAPLVAPDIELTQLEWNGVMSELRAAVFRHTALAAAGDNTTEPAQTYDQKRGYVRQNPHERQS